MKYMICKKPYIRGEHTKKYNFLLKINYLPLPKVAHIYHIPPPGAMGRRKIALNVFLD
jgi:hypothetical protein